MRVAKKAPIVFQQNETLLDVVDSLIDKGVAVDAEVVLGLADIDLIYLRAGALLAAADKVLDVPVEKRRKRPRRGVVSNPRPPSHGVPGARSVVAAPQTTDAPRRVDLRAHDTADRAQGTLATAAANDTSRSVIKLVLTLVDFVRQLLERQAVRRVTSGSLDEAEVERLGRALMQLEQTVHALAAQHDIDPADLTLEIGPLGRLK